MTRILASTIIVLLFASCSSNVIYLDSNNHKITSKQFEVLNKQDVRVVKTKNDTAIIKQIFRKHIKLLNFDQLHQVNTALTEIIGARFDKNKNTIVHLYRKNGPEIKTDAEHERYWPWLAAHSDTHNLQAFLIGTKNSEIKTNHKKHTYLDSDDFFNNMFFSNSSFEINHLYIKPSGEVYVYYGGKDILLALDWSL